VRSFNITASHGVLLPAAWASQAPREPAGPGEQVILTPTRTPVTLSSTGAESMG
jgi:hypothetical protein